ncbi:MAG TPA: DUF664 domain-containing protein [Streptosporangiaceae bacterium]|jgi:hypothetical protein
MTSADLLTDAFGRIREEVHLATDGLSREQLAYRVDAEANSIAWLIWHLTRIQDDHVCGVAHRQQAWTAAGWAHRFGLPFGPEATGYGHDPREVAAVQADAETLTGYHDAVFEDTIRYVGTLTDADLPVVVDESWDPPVTLGVRLVSVISDDLQHVGQAAFIRGFLLRQ